MADPTTGGPDIAAWFASIRSGWSLLLSQPRKRVTLAEIDRQRSLGWPDFHPEDFCHQCGGRNPIWWVDSDRFNAAYGHPSEHPHNGIVCPSCFVADHESATGMQATWRLVPEAFKWPETGEPE